MVHGLGGTVVPQTPRGSALDATPTANQRTSVNPYTGEERGIEELHCSAHLTSGVVAVQLLSVQLARVAGVRMDGAYVVSHRVLGIIIAVAVGVFFVVAHIVPRKSKDSFPTDYDRTGLLLLSSLSAVLLLGGSWAVWCGAGATLAWMGFATNCDGRACGARGVVCV